MLKRALTLAEEPHSRSPCQSDSVQLRLHDISGRHPPTIKRMHEEELSTADFHCNLTGRTALITGASRGIGRAVAQRLSLAGADIILHYNRDYTAAKRAAGEVHTKGEMVQADLRNPGEIEAMFRYLAAFKLDILVNNAGVWFPTPLGSTSAEEVNRLLDINLKAVFLVTQAALPLLNFGGRIINISSVAGRIATAGKRSLYGASKAAVDSLTRNWALELAPRRILVNAVAPGYVETDMTTEHLSDAGVRKRALDRHPLGRLGNTAEIAAAVLFLCSDAARWITGQSINVSGGFVV
jgi:NAD(P)-dependent dehydrogenase (short-subunit alcohol dehydrogenase family)